MSASTSLSRDLHEHADDVIESLPRSLRHVEAFRVRHVETACGLARFAERGLMSHSTKPIAQPIGFGEMQRHCGASAVELICEVPIEAAQPTNEWLYSRTSSRETG